MQRLSQVSLHLSQDSDSSGSQARPNFTPPSSDRGDHATTNNTIAKMKVVVTRKLFDEAQALLDAKKEELEVAQWGSEKVRLSGRILA
jgi:hypothetical protein